MDRRRRRGLCSPDAAAPLSPTLAILSRSPVANRVIDANGLALAHVMVSRGYASLSFLHGAAETIADLGEDRTAPR
jgi:hypothetical protein